MLLQSMGIMTALAFVLGLIGVAVWIAKRFGGATVNPGARIQIEVVQRIPFGPKAGLAVVRVGEKVMAVSIGPDGIRPLFEVDEADRQRVIATSQVATPFATTADAGRALSKMFPAALGQMIGRSSFANANANAINADVTHDRATIDARRTSAREAVEIPSFLTQHAPNLEAPAQGFAGVPTQYTRGVSSFARPASNVDREFRSVLNIAMSGATKLAVFFALVGLSSVASSSVHAQGAPPVVPPLTAVPVTTPATVSSGTSNTAAPAAVPAAVPATGNSAPTIALPVAPSVSVPAFVVPKGAPRTARPAQIRPAPARKTAAPPVQSSADSAKKPLAKATTPTAPNIIQPPSHNSNGARAATPAPVAGSDDAFANMVPQMDLKLGDGKDGGLRLSGTVGIVVMMGLLTLLPTLLLMMTGFTRILIVLHFLKQAMGTQAAPPAQLLAAMALLLTGFVMAPTFTEVNKTALEPWMDGKITQVEMLQTGVKPLRTFMLKQTRESDLRTFIGLSKLSRPNTVDDVPLHVLMSAFVASELRTSFQIGFMIYLPFIVIDAVVASVLMSMGMFMLPPAMISMPFKLLLFVLVDGWGLTIHALVQSFK